MIWEISMWHTPFYLWNCILWHWIFKIRSNVAAFFTFIKGCRISLLICFFPLSNRGQRPSAQVKEPLLLCCSRSFRKNKKTKFKHQNQKHIPKLFYSHQSQSRMTLGIHQVVVIRFMFRNVGVRLDTTYFC